MEFYPLSAVVNMLTSIVLGFLVFSSDRKNLVNRMFALFAGAVALWSAGYFFWQISDSSATALFWVRVLMGSAIFIPFFYTHFVVLFLEKDGVHRSAVYLGYLFAFLFFFADFTSLFISAVQPILSFPYWPVPGILFHPFLFIWLFYVAYPTVLLVRTMRDAHAERRQQIKYTLIGMTVGYLGGASNYFLWYGIPVLPIGNVLVSVYVLMVAYSILKHHLFSIKVIATEIFVFALWFFILFKVFLSDTVREQVYDIGLLAATILVGTVLIRSVIREVDSREHIERLAAKLKVANTRLKELDERKSEFLSMASHQLRTPLTAIKGYASMLLEGSFGEIGEAVRKPLDTIFKSSNRLVQIIEDFLTISRIEQNRLAYNFEKAELKELVSGLVADFSEEARKKGLTLTFSADGDGTYEVMIDKGKIMQIVSNLIDNAVKYTPKGSVAVTVGKSSPSTVRVTISDTGIGMDSETRKKIFQKFSRAKDANLTNITGTGLGLYVATRLIVAHKGKIWAESKGKGKGSAFYIELPLA